MKNAKREMIMAALLINPTVREAAIASGVPQSTIFNWLRDEGFNKEYNERKRQAVNEAGDFLQSKMTAAAMIIDELMHDVSTPPLVRLNAARAIIEMGLRVVEQREIIGRIEALEAIKNDTGS